MTAEYIPGIPRDVVTKPTGVFGGTPKTETSFFDGAQGATPKYARNSGAVTDDFRETMARFFVYVDPEKAAARIDGAPRKLQRAASRLYKNGYIDFILQSVQTGLVEKLDVSDNLSGGYVAYYLGTSPQTLQCTGALLNSMQDDQVVSMVNLYLEFLRGTKLAEHGETLRLRYDSFLYTGYVNNLQWSLAAENELVCPFSFNFLVKTRTLIPSSYFIPVSLDSAPDITGGFDAVGPTLVPQKTVVVAEPVAPPPAATGGPPPTNEKTQEAYDAARQKIINKGGEPQPPPTVSGDDVRWGRE